MMIFKAIANALSASVIHIGTEETNTNVRERYRLSQMKVDRITLGFALAKINSRDNFSVGVLFSNSDQVTSLESNESEAIDNFCHRLELHCDDDDDDELVSATVTVSITKGFKDKTTTIYSLDHIEKYWRLGGIGQAANKIQSLSEKVYILESAELQQTFATSLFVFRPSTINNLIPTNPELPNKHKLISTRDKSCLFYESKSYPFIPQDFSFDSPISHIGIGRLFGTLQLVFAIVYIADISSLSTSELTATIKGYRHVSGSIVLGGHGDQNIALAYYEIYIWAYGDGSTTDKLGIARNLLSIHIEDDNFRKVKDGSMNALISNYSIYLKENVKQYIDIKNKLSDQIQKQSDKANDMVKSIGGYLRTSIFTVYSFVITTFIVRSISKTSADVTFNHGVYIIFLMFLVLSICTLVYAYKECTVELERFESIYNSFKSRFDDLIAKSDRDRILQNDAEFNRDVAYVKASRFRAVVLWGCALGAVFLFVTVVKLLCY